MKARLASRDLREALGIVKPAVNPRSPFVTLDTTGEGLLVAADNHEEQIRTLVGEVFIPKRGGAGVVAAPYRYLAELAAHLEDDVELAAKDTLQVQSGSTQMTLPLAIDGEVPNRKVPEADEVAIDVVDWEAIHRVSQHCSTEEGRVILQTTFFQGDCVVGTDGNRLAVYEVDTGINSLVPARSITKVKDEEIDHVRFVADDKAVMITVGSTTAWGSPVQGEPPPWRRVVPEASERRIVFDSESLRAALERVQITARILHGAGRAVTLEPLEEGTVTLRSQPEAAEVFGDCSEVVEMIDGELPWPIGMNSRYLIEAIDVIDSDKFELELGADNKKATRTTHAGFSIVLMPLNLSS